MSTQGDAKLAAAAAKGKKMEVLAALGELVAAHAAQYPKLGLLTLAQLVNQQQWTEAHVLLHAAEPADLSLSAELLAYATIHLTHLSDSSPQHCGA